MRKIWIASFVALFYWSAEAQTLGYRIDTVVPRPPTPEGKALTDALLDFPADMAFDPDGRIALIERGRGADIWHEGDDGLLHAAAGTGQRGFSGDGGPATAAELNVPRGIAFDAQGRLYVADRENHRVRRVDLDGTIRTVAGNGRDAFSGDGGVATEAALNTPVDVAIAPNGDLVIADERNRRVRRVNSAGQIDTIAGNGEFSPIPEGGELAREASGAPRSVDVDALGRVYFPHVLPGASVIDTNGILQVSVVPRNVPDMGIPNRVAVDSQGNAYYTSNSVVHRATGGGLAERVAGTGSPRFGGDGGPALDADLAVPQGLAIAPDDSLIIADSENQVIRRVADGIIETIVGRSRRIDPRTVVDTELFDPMGIAVAPNGDLVVSSRLKHSVDRLERRPDGTFDRVTTVVGNGFRGGFLPDGDPATENRTFFPWGVAFHPDGRLMFAESANRRIRALNADGTFTTFAGGGEDRASEGPATSLRIGLPGTIDFAPNGRAVVTTGVVREITPDGTMRVLTRSGQSLTGDGWPAIDATVSGPGDARFAPNGDILIADTGNDAIRRIDSDGVTSTLVGDGVEGFSGDGGPASNARLNAPINLEISDTGRRVHRGRRQRPHSAGAGASLYRCCAVGSANHRNDRRGRSIDRRRHFGDFRGPYRPNCVSSS